MAKKRTADGLVAYAKAQVGKPYWAGGFGQNASRSLYDQNKARLDYGPWEGDYELDIGKKVHDCNGLIKGYCWTDGPDIPWKSGQYEINGCGDWAVGTMYDKCSEKGSINQIPKLPGILVFTKSFSHMGVFDGKDRIFEARGHAYGVQDNLFSSRTSFALWGKASWLEYGKIPGPDGSYPEFVISFQKFLNEKYGRGLATDGRCGPATKMSAIAAMQAELNLLGENLAVDGYCGPATRAALNRNIVSFGTKGNRAFIIQGLLYGNGYDCAGFDGSVGPGCDGAIKRFQQNNGLKIDGRVGSETFYRLTR